MCGGIARAPLTLIVLESTANGVGNYFHAEWLRSVRGESDKAAAVFVPWTEIDIYADEVRDAAALWEAMDDYERKLWTTDARWSRFSGITTSAVSTRRANDGRRVSFRRCGGICQHRYGVFGIDLVSRLRERCLPPVAVGDVTALSLKGFDALEGVRFVADSRGPLSRCGISPTTGCRVGTTAMSWRLTSEAARLQATSRSSP